MIRRRLSVLFLGLALTAPAAQADPISRNYSEVVSYLNEIAANNPGTVQKFDLGVSDNGQVIQGLRIGNGPVKNLLVATHHGNEYGSTEVAKAFAKSVAAAPIAGQTLFVIPVLNIGGYNQRNRYERNLDPNRDYPGPCATSGPFKLKDTSALAQFVDREGIVASATLHTFSPAIVYPWGMSTHDTGTQYDDIFKMLVQAATVESGYPSGNNTQLIYPADGTFEDYAFWKHGIWSILGELGDSHSPDQATVDQMVAVNVPGFRRMFEQSPHQRAEKHDFTGHCDVRLKSLDRGDE